MSSNEIMVVRIVQSDKQNENDEIVEVEDESSVQKMDIGDELVWTGMVMVGKLDWESGMYRLR